MRTPTTDLERAPPQAILAWAIGTYAPRVGLTSSFGIESAALLHMASVIDPGIRVIFLDTGYLFPETLRYAEELKRLLRLNLHVYRATPEQILATRRHLESGGGTAGTCCDTVKVELMQEALAGLDCWIAGLRRDQSRTRRDTPFLQTIEGGRVKVHPLASWSAAEVRGYMVDNGLPLHPLWYRGYTSVGCAPCTTRPTDVEDLRSGRWPGKDKTECGLHVSADRVRADR